MKILRDVAHLNLSLHLNFQGNMISQSFAICLGSSQLHKPSQHTGYLSNPQSPPKSFAESMFTKLPVKWKYSRALWKRVLEQKVCVVSTSIGLACGSHHAESSAEHAAAPDSIYQHWQHVSSLPPTSPILPGSHPCALMPMHTA